MIESDALHYRFAHPIVGILFFASYLSRLFCLSVVLFDDSGVLLGLSAVVFQLLGRFFALSVLLIRILGELFVHYDVLVKQLALFMLQLKQL